MVFFGAALGLLLNILFWGLGLSWLCTPRRWRLAWPVFTGLAGVGLQSAVVWFGVQMDWSGTESYGRWALLVPVGLLLLAWKLRWFVRLAALAPPLGPVRVHACRSQLHHDPLRLGVEVAHQFVAWQL
jgi:hypothetical protein